MKFTERLREAVWDCAYSDRTGTRYKPDKEVVMQVTAREAKDALRELDELEKCSISVEDIKRLFEKHKPVFVDGDAYSGFWRDVRLISEGRRTAIHLEDTLVKIERISRMHGWRDRIVAPFKKIF